MAPDPDIDQPTPYDQIAQLVTTGIDTSGIVDKFVQAHSAGLQTTARNVVTFVVKGIADLATLMVQTVFAALDSLDPAFGESAAAAAGNLFGVEVPAAAFTNIRDAGSRRAIGVAVGGVMLSMMKGDQADVGAGELQPSTTAAEAFLGSMTNLAVEEWTLDLVGEVCTLGIVRNLGELNQTMARSLGLSRLSRSVLRPFVKTLIADPAQWAVNKQYRPKMLSVPEAIRANFRGDVDDATLAEIAARDGYGDDALAALVALERKRRSPADIELLVRAGDLSFADALSEMKAIGYDNQAAIDAFNMEEARRYRTYQLAQSARIVAAYADHRIDKPTFDTQISLLHLDTTTLGRVSDEADIGRAINVLHLTRADVERAVKVKVLSVSDYSDWLRARGYAEVDALTLELLLQAEMQQLEDVAHLKAVTAAARAAARAAKDQAAAAKRDQVAGEHAHWSGTLGQAERLYVRAILSALEYRQILIDHAVAPGDADELVSVATQDRDARAALLEKRAAAKRTGKQPAVPLGTIIHAILLGARAIDALPPAMQAAGYSAADIALEVDLV